MWLMMQQDEPDDYVVATNEAHSVQEIVERSFSLVGLDWQKYVKTDERFRRPLDVEYLQGDYSKAKRKLGWEPQTKVNQLIDIMVKEDLDRWRRWLKGDRFPWDASNYPDENKVLSRMLKFER